MTPRLLYSADGCEVWHGDCLDPETVGAVMQGRRAELLHVDAPYSARTHDSQWGSGADVDAMPDPVKAPKPIPYPAWSGADVDAMCLIWLPHVAGWCTTVTDHVLAPEWARAFSATGRYTFAPLPWVETGSRIRLAGDGPSLWGYWAVVARPRAKPWFKWGTLPGAYVASAERRPGRIIGGKSLALTLQFLGDYSRRGDLVLDPCLGGGTTIMAARMSGRRCIGIEKDEGRAELCARLLAKKREQFDLFQ